MKSIQILILLFLASTAFAQEASDTTQGYNAEHVQFWMKTLETHPFIILRKQAARHLGSMQDTMAVPSLVKGLSDTNEDVRMQCAYSLGRLGDPNALRPLYELIEKDPSKQVQAAARNSIDKINSHEEFKRQQKQKLKELEQKSKSS